jgi:predicted PurR-regulated permease PerM
MHDGGSSAGGLRSGDTPPAQWRAQVIGALVLVGLGVLILWPFMVPAAWAAILAFATWPVFRRLERALGGRAGWAAGVMTLLMVLLVLGPFVAVSVALIAEIGQVFDEVRAWAPAYYASAADWLRLLPVVGPTVAAHAERMMADRGAIEQWVAGQAGLWARQAVGVVGNIGRNLAGAAVAVLTLFFFYRHGDTLLAQVQRVAHRLTGVRGHALLAPLGETLQAVTYGILLTALAQGTVATLGYWAVGLGAPVLLGAATAVLALIPFGAPMVYLPASGYLLAQGRPLAALVLLAWGVLVVSTIDNVVRSWVISSATRVPFLLIFFAVIGGLGAFGLLGLFVGPATVSLLLVLWREAAAPAPGDAIGPGQPDEGTAWPPGGSRR